MPRPFSRSWLVVISLLASCSTSSNNAPQDTGVDALSVPKETGVEVTAGDGASSDGNPAERAQSCYWQLQGGQWVLPHFRFLLTTPDGQAQSPPGPAYPLPDSSAPWPINDFEGQVVSQSGNQLAVDSCIPTLPCQPSLYRFTVCSGYGTCEAAGPGADISIPVPVGRRIHVVWHLDRDLGFCPGLYYLAIYDAEPGPGQGNLLFVGSGGRKDSTYGYSTNPMKDLPFSVTTERLWCGTAPTDAALYPWDDYAFVFTAKSGTSTPLRLDTGESGALDVAAPAGGVQRLQFHCIDAVQPGYTDDYWNWDFWASGDIPASSLDAGGASPDGASGDDRSAPPDAASGDDHSAPPDAASGDGRPAERAQSCYWQLEGGRYALPHFSFLLTTPDGQAQSPPSPYYPLPDGSAPWPINDFEGQVVAQGGNQLTVDSCIPTLPCQPSLYRFTVCSGFGPCQAIGTGADFSIPVPVGRRIRVVWHLDADSSFCPGLYYLALYDAEPGPTQGNLLFVGSGGRLNSNNNPGRLNPMKDLPFFVNAERLWCGTAPTVAPLYDWDDYAFLFTPKSGTSTPLRLATGESGTLDVAAPAGGVQRLDFHCIDAVQPDYTDDYWNWDFWASGEIPASSLDAGGGG